MTTARNGWSMQRFAAVAAVTVLLTALLYVITFVFLIPDAQKHAAPASLLSFYHHPGARQLTNVLLVVGGLAWTVSVIGIYERLREQGTGWALTSLMVGAASGLATVFHGIYLAYLLVAASRLYVHGDVRIKAGAIAAVSMPSPFNPGNFFLASLWLLVTGLLLLRSAFFPRPLGYLALVASAGGLFEFAATSGSLPGLLWLGIIGALIGMSLFWLWIGYLLWTRA